MAAAYDRIALERNALSPERLDQIVSFAWCLMADFESDLFDALGRWFVDSMRGCNPVAVRVALRRHDTVGAFLNRFDEGDDLPELLCDIPGLTDREALDVCEDTFAHLLRKRFPDSQGRWVLLRRCMVEALKAAGVNIVDPVRHFGDFPLAITFGRFAPRGPGIRSASSRLCDEGSGRMAQGDVPVSLSTSRVPRKSTCVSSRQR